MIDFRAELQNLANQLDSWARESKDGGWSTHQVEPMRRKADEIRRLTSSTNQTGSAKIEHHELMDDNYYSINGRLALLVEEALHRGRTVIGTSICAKGERFFASIIWKEN